MIISTSHLTMYAYIAQLMKNELFRYVIIREILLKKSQTELQNIKILKNADSNPSPDPCNLHYRARFC